MRSEFRSIVFENITHGFLTCKFELIQITLKAYTLYLEKAKWFHARATRGNWWAEKKYQLLFLNGNTNCNIHLDLLEMCNSSHPVGQPFDAEYLSQHSVHCSCWFSWSRKILNQCNVLSILHQYQWRCSLCFGKQAAIVWWMPQSLDHLWDLMLPGVKDGKGIARQSLTVSSPLGCYVTLRH